MEPPSGLKFKILNENSVDMSWVRPSTVIDGYRIQVVSVEGQYDGAGCGPKRTGFVHESAANILISWFFQMMPPEILLLIHTQPRPQSLT